MCAPQARRSSPPAPPHARCPPVGTPPGIPPRAGFIGPRVAVDGEVLPAACPVVPPLGHPPARVVAQVQVVAPLRGGCRARVRAVDHLAGVPELRPGAGPAPRTRQHDHDGSPRGPAPKLMTGLMANRSRPLLAKLPPVV